MRGVFSNANDIYYYYIPPYEPPLQSNADNTNMAY